MEYFLSVIAAIVGIVLFFWIVVAAMDMLSKLKDHSFRFFKRLKNK